MSNPKTTIDLYNGIIKEEIRQQMIYNVHLKSYIEENIAGRPASTPPLDRYNQHSAIKNTNSKHSNLER